MYKVEKWVFKRTLNAMKNENSVKSYQDYLKKLRVIDERAGADTTNWCLRSEG
jgi:hypothetical protein